MVNQAKLAMDTEWKSELLNAEWSFVLLFQYLTRMLTLAGHVCMYQIYKGIREGSGLTPLASAFSQENSGDWPKKCILSGGLFLDVNDYSHLGYLMYMASFTDK